MHFHLSSSISIYFTLPPSIFVYLLPPTHTHRGDDLSQTNTMADLSSEGTTYRLNGRKTWVTMAPDVTDWLVVLAKVRNSELSPVNEVEWST